MGTKKIKMPIISFEDLSTEEQLEWIENQTKKIIRRLPKLKEHLTMYDDKSAEIYNMQPEEIKLLSKTYQFDIKSGGTLPSLNNYIQQLTKYSTWTIKKLRTSTTKERIDSFLKSLRAIASEEEIIYVEKLLNSMTMAEKEGFVKSKFYWNGGTPYVDKKSTELEMFSNEYKGEHDSITPATANLENYLNHIGKHIDNWYVDKTTRYARGRKKVEKDV